MSLYDYAGPEMQHDRTSRAGRRSVLVRETGWTAALFLSAAAWTACKDPGAPAASGPSYLRAVVSGAASDTYEGTGGFGTGGDQNGGSVRTFSLSSSHRDTAGQRDISIWQQGSGAPPAIGTYAAGVPDYTQASWPGLSLVYGRYAGGGRSPTSASAARSRSPNRPPRTSAASSASRRAATAYDSTTRAGRETALARRPG